MNYDVIVVGAGPAGSTAAKYLAEKGFNVLLVDKERFPREKPCGGGIPINTFKRFSYLNEYKLIECYSYGGFIHSPSLKYSMKFSSEQPIVAMVSREEFDNGLVNIAIDSGTQFMDGKKVQDLQITDDKVRITLQDGSYLESKMLVGADGIPSIIAKRSGLASKEKMVNVCIFQEYEVGEKIMDEYSTEKRLSHIHLQYDGVPGYAWIFPKKDRFNIGIGEFMPYRKHSTKKVRLIDVYKSYFQLLKQKRLVPKDLDIGKCKGGIVPVFPLDKTYSNRLILCGDAAGFINPISGGGIYFAMASGEIASKIITKAFESENFYSSYLLQYQTQWKEDFGKDLQTFSRFTNIWLRQTEQFIRVASKDERFGQIASDFLYGNLRIRDHRWKLILYYLQDRLKDFFGLL
jgi:geranylgeranyl reductase family protein